MASRRANVETTGTDFFRCDRPVLIGTLVLLLGLVPGQLAKGQNKKTTKGSNERFETIFNGKDLSGWHPVPKDSDSDWSVENGAIIGRGSENRLAYLAWKEDDLTDFVLELKYRLPGKGNTGIEIRSQVDASGKRPFEGYHADLGHVGIGPHILGAWDFHFAKRKEFPCPRGKRLFIDANGKAKTEKIKDAIKTKDIRKNGWNSVRVIARGTHFQFFINGRLASEFTDQAKTGRLDRGAIGLQIHDKGMQVEFKDIRLHRLQQQK